MKETKYAGTQTEKNLMAAFACESEARNKYTYFASKAKKEGYEQKRLQLEGKDYKTQLETKERVTKKQTKKRGIL